MLAMDDGFELSKWYNSSARNVKERHDITTEATEVTTKRTSASSFKAEVDPATQPSSSECFICRMPNPEYWSTNAVKTAPSVPVCSIECEARYLEQRGMKAANKRVTHCHICRKANPKTWSGVPAGNSNAKEVPSVPVCDAHCEALYFKRNGIKAKHTVKVVAQNKRTKQDQDEDEEEDDSDFEEITAPLQKKSRSAYFAATGTTSQLPESDNGQSYKSWWIGALAFYSFVYQRHGMWHCYSMGDNDPRVEPCLTKFWTCNMYRELDRSTAYLRKHVLRWQIAHQGRLSLREVLWMAVCFRLCNKLETFDKLKGIPSSDAFRPFKKKVLALTKKKDESVTLCAGNRLGFDAAKYLAILEEFVEVLDPITFQVKQCMNVQQVFEELRAFGNNALGSFTSWQVVADLVELNMLGDHVDTDNFVWLSRDAQQSLVQIFGKRRARPSEFVALAKLLQQRQVQGFQALQVQFPYFLQQKLNLKNIGHALHVFQHYRNMKLMEGKQSHKIEPGTTIPALYASRSYLLDNEVCEVCNKGDNADEQLLCDLCNRLFHKYCLQMKELPPASWVCVTCMKLLHLPEQGLVTPPDVISVE